MHSMTGFGRGEAVADGVIWRAEISSINRKQLEIIVHLPRELGELETPLRNRLAEKLSRGRVQANLTADRGSISETRLKMDEGLARQYVESLQKLAGNLQSGSAFNLAEMVRWPGVFTLEETTLDTKDAQPLLESALDAALTQLLAMRRTEGSHLKIDINGRLGTIQTLLEEARSLSPQVTARLRDTMRQRLAEAGLPLPLDDERLIKEIAIFADRTDISEEITRAESHISQFRSYMDSGEPVGRALDFLSQELFRELNTMGSKASHAGLAQLVVRAKTELEKVREQVQNIE